MKFDDGNECPICKSVIGVVDDDKLEVVEWFLDIGVFYRCVISIRVVEMEEALGVHVECASEDEDVDLVSHSGGDRIELNLVKDVHENVVKLVHGNVDRPRAIVVKASQSEL
ncbi:hypothetical protein V6N13_059396 [Hibiscus sabdariffa]